MRLRPPPRTRSRQAMTSSSPPRTPVWGRRRSAVPAHAFAQGLAFVLAVAAEFRRAAAAEQRYEDLKHNGAAAFAREGIVRADVPRRVFEEFYS
jgi:hypothetical protein